MKAVRAAQVSVRPLTKEEIDRRIESLVAQVTGADAAGGGAGEDAVRPRWISPGELVRRLRPFIVYN
jgi:hypothetical protein